MRPTQLALLHSVVRAAQAACEHAAAATLDAAHLRGLLFERMLEDGCTLLESTGEPGQGRLLRLDDAVVRVERIALPGVGDGRTRVARPPDLRLWTPERLGVDVHARGSFVRPGRDAGAALLHRLARLARRESDVLLLACDRRSYDRLRWLPSARDGDLAAGVPVRRGRPTVREGDAEDAAALRALCAAVLPSSAALHGEPAEHEAEVGRGMTYVAHAAVTPMVFGVQRVVVGLWLRGGARARVAGDAAELQLDAFPA
jgi:hypothetical protein